MERRLGWSRRLCAAVLVLAIVIVLGAVVLVVIQAAVGAVRDFSDDLPRIVEEARHSDLGSFINAGSDSLDTLAQHASEITSGVAKVSGGVADVGVSAFGAVTLVFSVMFLTLFGLIDETRLRDWIGGLLYRGERERFLQVTDRIVQTDLALHARQPGDLGDLRNRVRRHRGDPRRSVPARSGGDRRGPRPDSQHRGHHRRHHRRARRALGQPSKR